MERSVKGKGEGGATGGCGRMVRPMCGTVGKGEAGATGGCGKMVRGQSPVLYEAANDAAVDCHCRLV